MLPNLRMRLIRKGRNVALKLFWLIKPGFLVGKEAWTNYIKLLLEKVTNVAQENMRKAVKDMFRENKRNRRFHSKHKCLSGILLEQSGLPS